MGTRELLAHLRQLGPVLEAEPMSRHTTVGIGGPADLFVIARSAHSLAAIVQLCRSYDVPFFVLGNGSNILVSDKGIRGVVIDNRARQVSPPEEHDGGAQIEVESGMSCAALARRLARAGLAGFEWAVGIPGTLGGACYTNAGAYGGQLADHLISAVIIDPAGEVRQIDADGLCLGYRRSALSGRLRGSVVLSVHLALRYGEPLDLLAYVRELEAKRRATQPTNRNVGSMFKNPGKYPAWWYIDQAGLRGHRIGAVEISRKHANFFINRGGGRAADVMALVELVQRRVREQFNVELELEVIPVGEGF